MLIFWNLAGVPMSYCHCTLYLATHHPDTYRWNRLALCALFAAYLFAYWVWDTGNSQKNFFRAQERGIPVDRKTFPQLPWKYVKNPDVIRTKTGDSILCSGWCTSPLPFTSHFNDADSRRWFGPQSPLYMRPLLRHLLGSDHRLQLAVPVVLFGLLCGDDSSSCEEGYPSVSGEVWGGLDGV